MCLHLQTYLYNYGNHCPPGYNMLVYYRNIHFTYLRIIKSSKKNNQLELHFLIHKQLLILLYICMILVNTDSKCRRPIDHNVL